MWLDERLSALRVLGLTIGVGGVAIMVGWSPMPMTFATALAVVAMLGASASYAAAGVYARLELRGVPAHTLAFGQQLGALAWLALPAVALAPRTPPPPVAIGAVLALGALSTAVAYLLYFRLLERIGPTRTSTVTFLLPVFGLLFGALFLGEQVTAGMVVGFAVVVAGVVLVTEVRFGALLARPAPQGRAS